jgi:hypothetical protein
VTPGDPDSQGGWPDTEPQRRTEVDRLAVDPRGHRCRGTRFQSRRVPGSPWNMGDVAGGVEDDDPQMAAVECRAGAAGERTVKRVGVVRHEHDGKVPVLAAQVVKETQLRRLRAGAQHPSRGFHERTHLGIAVGRAADRIAVDAERDVLRNVRPFTSAMSIWRSTPSVNASSAPVTSRRSTPTSSAKWLRVPAGTHTKGIPYATAVATMIASDPSPPAIPSASAPPAAASRTSAARSWPGESTTTSIPCSRARSATPARAALPPPDLGLTNNTGRRGGPAGCQPYRDSCRLAGLIASVRDHSIHHADVRRCWAAQKPSKISRMPASGPPAGCLPVWGNVTPAGARPAGLRLLWPAG